METVWLIINRYFKFYLGELIIHDVFHQLVYSFWSLTSDPPAAWLSGRGDATDAV